MVKKFCLCQSLQLSTVCQQSVVLYFKAIKQIDNFTSIAWIVLLCLYCTQQHWYTTLASHRATTLPKLQYTALCLSSCAPSQASVARCFTQMLQGVIRVLVGTIINQTVCGTSGRGVPDFQFTIRLSTKYIILSMSSHQEGRVGAPFLLEDILSNNFNHLELFSSNVQNI